jgi:hypothetical protein
MQTLYIKIGLNQLVCHHRADGWNYSEPYLWNVFFKVDGSCVTLNGQFRLEGKPEYHFSEGSHGNLHAKDMQPGETIGIPKEVGEWKTSLTPIPLPYFTGGVSGVIGLVSVLMEQNLVSGKGAEAGHQALNENVQKGLESILAQFDPKKIDINDIDGSLRRFFESQAEEFDRIGTLVGQAVMNAQNVVQNLISLVNKDAVIGYKIWDFSNAALEKANGELPFRHRWTTRKYGDWEVKGSCIARTDPEVVNVIKRKSPEEEEE